MKTASLNNEARYYIGSSVKLANRICSHRCYIVNLDKYKNTGSPVFYKNVKKYGWLEFKMAILEYLDLKDVTDTLQKRRVLLLKEQYYLDNINPSLNVRLAANLPSEVMRDTNLKVNKNYRTIIKEKIN
jgi:group I intron endonuclease